MWMALLTAPALALNPLAPFELTTADLDADGVIERISAGFADGGDIVVRAWEDGEEVALHLGPRHDIAGPRDELRLSTTSAEETGVPLIQVTVPAGPYCGSGTTVIWVSLFEGQLVPALEVMTSWVDAPVWSQTRVTWHPDDLAVTLVATSGDYDEEAEQVQTRELVWRDGRFVER